MIITSVNWKTRKEIKDIKGTNSTKTPLKNKDLSYLLCSYNNNNNNNLLINITDCGVFFFEILLTG